MHKNDVLCEMLITGNRFGITNDLHNVAITVNILQKLSHLLPITRMSSSVYLFMGNFPKRALRNFCQHNSLVSHFAPKP